MIRVSGSLTSRFGLIFALSFCATAAGCGGGNTGTPDGFASSGTAGAVASSSASGGTPSGGAGTGSPRPIGGIVNTPSGGRDAATGGTNPVVGGGKSCIAANPNIPKNHSAEGFDTEPCSGCHGTAMSGGFVFDSSGKFPISEATVTLTPPSGAKRTAVTGSNGMFSFQGDITAPFEACVSKCPDTVCSKVTDHADAGDCGICHGATTTQIHLP